MTVHELIEALSSPDIDPSALILIDTCGFHRGLFPCADGMAVSNVHHDGENYDTIILGPSRWPGH